MVAVVAAPVPVLAFLNNQGEPNAGGSLLTQVGSANYVTYSDSAGSVPLPNPIPLNSRGEVSTAAGASSQLFLVPNTVYNFTLFDNAGNQLWSEPYINGVQLTLSQTIIGNYLYPISAAETAAAVTIVQPWLPYGYVDRYGANTTPGTTDMTAAWNAAASQALQVGGAEITYNGENSYLTSAPINCTVSGAPATPGIKIRQLGGGLDTGNGILAVHTGVAAFDFTGCDWVVLEDVTIHTGSTTFPKVGVLFARNTSGGSCFHRMSRVKIQGNFGVSCYYNYVCEDDYIEGCYFANSNLAANTKTRVYTNTNTKFALASVVPGLIFVGSNSCTDHTVIGCQDLNNAGTSTTDCIYVEGTCDGIHNFGGWAFTAAGRALWYFDMATGASNYGQIIGLKADQGTQMQLYGVLFSNDVATPIGMEIRDCFLPNLTYAIACAGSNPTLAAFCFENIGEQSAGPNGIDIPGIIEDSNIHTGITILKIGTSTNNSLIGFTDRWTITTRNNDNWTDIGTANKSFAPGISSGTNGWTSVGAITQTGNLLYNGNQANFEIVIAGATSIACTNTATISLPFTAKRTTYCSLYYGTSVIGCSIVGSTLTVLTAITATSSTLYISGQAFVA